MLRLCNYKRANKRLVLMDRGILSFVSKNGNVTELICILSRLTQPDQKFAKHMCAELPLLESALHLCLCKHHSKWSNSRKLSALIMSCQPGLRLCFFADWKFVETFLQELSILTGCCDISSLQPL